MDEMTELPEQIVKLMMQRYEPSYMFYETLMPRSLSGTKLGSIYCMIDKERFEEIDNLPFLLAQKVFEQASTLVIHKIGNSYQVMKDRYGRFSFELKGLEKVLYE